jgi:hypothetical protein
MPLCGSSLDNIKGGWMDMDWFLIKPKPSSRLPPIPWRAQVQLPPLFTLSDKMPFDESHPSNPSNTFISLSLSLSPPSDSVHTVVACICGERNKFKK